MRSAKLNFKGAGTMLFLATCDHRGALAGFMVPQFMMMRSWHLNNTHLAIIFLRAFAPSAFS